MDEVEEQILSDYLSFVNEGKEIFGPRSNLLENPSSPGQKEESQKQDLKFGMIEESQSSSSLSNSEDLEGSQISNNFFIEAKNELSCPEQEKPSDDKEEIDYITEILKESTITFIINDNKENIIKFGKIKYKNREATYEKIINPSKEKQNLQFEYNKYSKKYKKLKRYLNRIKDNTINYFSKINLGEELLIKIKIKEDSINNKKIIYSEYFIEEEFLKDKKPYQDKYILKRDNYL